MNEKIKRMKQAYSQMALGLSLIEDEDSEWARRMEISANRDSSIRHSGITPEQELTEFLRAATIRHFSPDELVLLEKLTSQGKN
jgi:hypothetical protein